MKSMNCHDVEQDLGALQDGELPAGERARVESHLAECAQCRSEQEAMAEVTRQIEDLPAPPLPDRFNARVLEALGQRQQLPGWADRVRAMLESMGRFFLGSGDPAPLGAGAFIREALGGGLATAGVLTASTWLMWNSRMCLYRTISPMPRAVEEHLSQYPICMLLGFSSLTVFWLVLLGCLILAMVGVRLLHLPALVRAFRSREPLPPAAVGMTLAGVWLLLLINCTFLIFGEIVWENPLKLQASPFPYLLGVLIVVSCALMFGCLVRYGRHRVMGLALAFYAALVLTWVGDTWTMGVWDCLQRWLYQSEEVGLGIATTPAWKQAVLLFVAVPLSGLIVAVLLGVVAWRGQVSAAARRREILAPAALLLGLALLPLVGLAGTSIWQLPGELTGSLAEQMSLENRPSHARTRVMLTGPEDKHPRATPVDVPGILAPENVRRMEAFLRSHPTALIAPQIHQLLIASARLDLDEDLMWRRIEDYMHSPVIYPWAPGSMLWNMATASPHNRLLSRIRWLVAPEQTTIPNWRFMGRSIARGLQRHGAPDEAARYWALDSTPPDERATKPFTVGLRTGEIRGRILLDGKPATGLPLRIVQGRDTRYAPPDRAADLVRLLTERQLFRDHVSVDGKTGGMWVLTSPFLATRTDAQGRFRFQGLCEDRYFLVVQLDCNADEALRLCAGVQQGVIELSTSHPRADVGDIRLGGQR